MDVTGVSVVIIYLVIPCDDLEDNLKAVLEETTVGVNTDEVLGCDGRVVSVPDSQPQDRGFESCVIQLAHQKLSRVGYG